MGVVIDSECLSEMIKVGSGEEREDGVDRMEWDRVVQMGRDETRWDRAVQMGRDDTRWDGVGCREQANQHHTHVSYLSGAVAERGSQFYGISDGYIFLDNNKCAGNESSLLECPNTNADPEVCNHDLDAGVTCKGQLIAMATVYYFQTGSGSQLICGLSII